MRKSLIRHGNSLALVIDKPILNLLQINPDTPMEISKDGDRLFVRPCPYSKPSEATGRVPSGNQWRIFRGSTQACGVTEKVEFLEALGILAIHQD